jgi:hypothetical protein
VTKKLQIALKKNKIAMKNARGNKGIADTEK